MTKHNILSKTIQYSIVWLLLLTNHLPSSLAFSVSSRRMRTQLYVTRDEYLKPHFETPTMIKSYDFDFERIVECAKSVTGECPIEEMTQMMEELERLSTKTASSDTERVAEDHGARQIVYHALQSQVEMALARSELEEAGFIEKTAELQPPPPSPRDINDLFRQMRDIADHEEV